MQSNLSGSELGAMRKVLEQDQNKKKVNFEITPIQARKIEESTRVDDDTFIK
jgi:hypothetical protein